MSKLKNKKKPPNQHKAKAAESPKVIQPPQFNPRASRSTREFVESIVIAIVLAFLFRGFEAEAFVIPTGSMAPTLYGNHKDVVCPECGFRYSTGASIENKDNLRPERVIGTTCPICHYLMDITQRQRTYTGDRILVGKFVEPKAFERWDIIVFKFPGDAKQNYIKRLIGLPGEKVMVHGGDIYIQSPGENEFHIARKPAGKTKAMLQLVDDNRFIADSMKKAGWPARWQPWARESVASPAAWRAAEDGHAYETDGAGGEAWLRYRHLFPNYDDWGDLAQGRQPPGLMRRRGKLITDFCAYNAIATEFWPDETKHEVGAHWAPDLALETEVEVKSAQGMLLLDIVQGGVHYECQIDIATGRAELTADRGAQPFDAQADDASASPPTAETSIRGAGVYRLRFSNVDRGLKLWVNNKLIAFSSPATYTLDGLAEPKWRETDPLDIAPVGVGVRGAAVKLNYLRVLRDVYYIAISYHSHGADRDNDYDLPQNFDTEEIFSNPKIWATTKLFASRRKRVFPLQNDQFFPMGDNSPASSDARLWPQGSFVERDLMIGKALMIYWPSPQVTRIGLIR